MVYKYINVYIIEKLVKSDFQISVSFLKKILAFSPQRSLSGSIVAQRLSTHHKIYIDICLTEIEKTRFIYDSWPIKLKQVRHLKIPIFIKVRYCLLNIFTHLQTGQRSIYESLCQ